MAGEALEQTLVYLFDLGFGMLFVSVGVFVVDVVVLAGVGLKFAVFGVLVVFVVLFVLSGCSVCRIFEFKCACCSAR